MKIKTKSYIIVCLLLIIALIFMIIGVAFFDREVFAETKLESINEYLNSDSLKNTPNKTIQDYAGSLIGTNAAVQYNNDKYSIANTNSDDPIIEIIPESYFYTLGSTLEIGKEYGFFIKTDKVDGIYKSTALVFDISMTTDDPTMVDTAIVSVSPLFEYKYICVQGNGTITMDDEEVSYSTVSYCVLPVACIDGENIYYQQTDEFYLKDISFSSTLYNEQALNVGDPGYSAENDYGSFFTGYDYAYNGKVREYGEFPDEEITAIMFDSLEMVFGIAASATSFFPPLSALFSMGGSILSISQTATDVIELVDGVKKYTDGEIVQKEKLITTTCFYTNREDQLNHYTDGDNNPALMKIASVVCNTGTEQSLWYGVGDDASAYFYIGHGAQAGMDAYYTRILTSIGLKVVSSENDNVMAIGTGVTSDSLHEPVDKNIQLEETGDIYMFPEGEDHFEMAETLFESDYVVDIHLTDMATIKVNGKSYTGKDFTITQNVKKGQRLAIDLSDNTVGLKGTIKVSPATDMDTIDISANGEYLIKANLQGVRQLQSSNPNVEIQAIYTMSSTGLQKYTTFGEIKPDGMISYPFEEEIYYIVLHNASSSAVTTNLTVSDLPTLSIDDDNTADLQANNVAYFKINAPSSKNYILSLNNIKGNDFSFQLLNNELEILNGNSYLNGTYIFSLSANKNYYIGICTGKEESSATISVRETENAFAWQIFGEGFDTDGEMIEDGLVEVTRGYTYTLKFCVNGEVYETAIIVQDQQTSFGNYDVTYNADDGIVTIPKNSPLGGNGITVKAWASVDDDTSYNHTLTLVPKLGKEIANLMTYSDDDLGFTIELPKYVSGVSYIVSIGNKKSEELSASTNYLDDINTLTVSILKEVETLDISDAKDVLIEITKIKFVDALKNTQEIDFTEVKNDSAQEILKVNNLFEGGSGTAQDPYIISDLRHLDNLRITAMSIVNHYKITSPIGFFDFDWTPIPRFQGTLTSENAQLRINLIKSDSANKTVGFIGMNYGTIKNLYIDFKGISLTTSENSTTDLRGDDFYRIGVVAGYNKGVIDGCYTTGDMEVKYTNAYAGAIVGYNAYDGTVSDCSTRTYITGNCNMGLVGATDGEILNCTNIGCYSIDIKFSSKDEAYNRAVGGIAGIVFVNGKISGCSNENTIICLNARTDNSSLAPYMGNIAGAIYCAESKISNNTSKNHLAPNDLHSGGALWWAYDQLKNVGKILNKQVGNKGLN